MPPRGGHAPVGAKPCMYVTCGSVQLEASCWSTGCVKVLCSTSESNVVPSTWEVNTVSRLGIGGWGHDCYLDLSAQMAVQTYADIKVDMVVTNGHVWC